MNVIITNNHKLDGLQTTGVYCPQVRDQGCPVKGIFLVHGRLFLLCSHSIFRVTGSLWTTFYKVTVGLIMKIPLSILSTSQRPYLLKMSTHKKQSLLIETSVLIGDRFRPQQGKSLGLSSKGGFCLHWDPSLGRRRN